MPEPSAPGANLQPVSAFAQNARLRRSGRTSDSFHHLNDEYEALVYETRAEAAPYSATDVEFVGKEDGLVQIIQTKASKKLRVLLPSASGTTAISAPEKDLTNVVNGSLLGKRVLWLMAQSQREPFPVSLHWQTIRSRSIGSCWWRATLSGTIWGSC